MSSRVVVVASTAFALAVSATLLAQTAIDGALAGRAPGAGTIVVEDSASGLRRSVITSAKGVFRVAGLPPGVYTVSYSNNSGETQSTQTAVVTGTTSNVDFDDVTVVLGELTITDKPINPIDFDRVESVTVITEEQIDMLPVARTATSVALLAPGTVKGDDAFGDLASFRGASVAESQYFINGMNVSNFQNGLDPALIPFDAYSQFAVLTEAWSAQYGRSTGGVINATTKSGTNEFHGGINVACEPDSLRADAPDTYYTEAGQPIALVYNSRDYRKAIEGNVWASGPIIKDKLFAYAIYNTRSLTNKDVAASTEQHRVARSDDPFWLVKVDAVPFANHRIEYTGFHDERSWTYLTSRYDFDQDIAANDGVYSYDDRGGSTHAGRYTGVFFEDLTVSALLGRSEQDRSSYSDVDFQPAVYDTRTGRTGRTGRNAWLLGNPDVVVTPVSLDTRQQLRLDVEYRFDLFGSHRLRVGYDREENETKEVTTYSGGIYYRYFTRSPGFTYNGGTFAAGGDVVRTRQYDYRGGFAVHSTAYYLEDNWTTMEDRLTLRLGIRNEEFQNFNKEGGTFLHIENQWAPRVGFVFDLFGDRRTKLSMSFGRHHLPVASNINVTLSGGEDFVENYYVLTGINPDSTPILGARIGDQTVYSHGEIPDPRLIVDGDIQPMYQDEWTIVLQHQLSKGVTVGLRGVVRDLDTVIDDMMVDGALIEWGVRNGMGTREELEGALLGTYHYVLGNPGRAMKTAWDFDGDGTLEDVLLTEDDLGFGDAVRKYYSAELFIERIWDGKWFAQASYTWAHVYGNAEGWVSSDNGQKDVGVLAAFDTPSLMIDSYGNLPNDVRHCLKAFGSCAVTPEFQVGLNAFLKSGRPINQFVNYDDPLAGFLYGSSYLLGHPRGTHGSTPWVFSMDLMLKWTPKHLGGFLGDRVTLGVDIFNILNADSATEVHEYFEEDQSIGHLNPRWGLGTSFQAPRSVRLTMAVEF